MRRKILKRVLWVVLASLGLLIVAGAYIAATFDPNEYKPELINLIKAKTGRTLDIQGPIHLSFFPKIGAQIEGASLSEPDSPQVFARIQQAKVQVALLPLLSRQIVIDHLTLIGLQAELVRDKDGQLNIEDLLQSDAEDAEDDEEEESESEKEAQHKALNFDIGGIVLEQATLGWRDEQQGRQLRLRDLNFHSTRIAGGVPGEMKLSAQIDGTQPKLALNIDLATHYRFDAGQRTAEFSKLSVKASGDAAGQQALKIALDSELIAFDFAAEHVRLVDTRLLANSANGLDASVSVPQMDLRPEQSDVKALSAALKMNQGARKIDARLDLSGLQSQGRNLAFEKLNLALDFRQDALALVGKLSSPLLVNLNEQALQLPKLIGDFNISGPNIGPKSVRLDLNGKLQLDWRKQTAHVDLRGKLEGSALALKLGLRQFKSPAIDFVLDADRLDVDRYRSKAVAATASRPAKESGRANDSAKAASVQQADAPIDLSALRTLDARGAVHIGALGVSGLKAQDFNLRLEAKDGRLHLSPITAKLYGGRLSGSVAIDAQRNVFAIKQTASGINIGPLLRDLADKDVLEGRGNVALDVRTSGRTKSALKRALDGSASLALKDGALKGINLAALLRKAKAALGSRSAAETQSTGGEKTDFSDLSASFAIAKGVAHNDDLLMRSPFLRVSGAGDVDIGASSMNYLLKATVVGSPTGQDGKDLAALRGITVPVRVSGSLDQLKYRPDISAMAKGAAKQQIEKQLEKHLGGKGSDKAGSIADQLLRGLIKKEQ